MMPRVADIARDLAEHAEAFCRVYLANGRKAGNYWQIGDRTGAPGRSLAVRLNASGTRPAGKWADHATSEYGDLLDLLAEQIDARSFAEVANEALRFLGQPGICGPKPSNDKRSAATSDHVEAGRKLFSYGKPFKGTPVEWYLRARGICRFGGALRYHPFVYYRDGDGALKEKPAMLAAITDSRGRITGCARTWLDIEHNRVAGIENPKRVLGQLHGNAVRLTAGRGGCLLIAGEGLETMLSVGTALPAANLAACLTAQHLAMFTPPSWCRWLWIARDNDEAGERAAIALRERAEDRGIPVLDLVPERNDFNDELMARGLSGLRRFLSEKFKPHLPGGRLPWE